MAKRDVRRVICAKARASNRHPMAMTFAPREIEHVVHDHALIGVMRFHPVGRMNSLVVKTVEIDRVRAINGDFSSVNIISDRADQAKVLILKVPAEGSWIEN